MTGKFITPHGQKKWYKGKGRASDRNIDSPMDKYQDKVLHNLTGGKEPHSTEEPTEVKEKISPTPAIEPMKAKPYTGIKRRVKKGEK